VNAPGSDQLPVASADIIISIVRGTSGEQVPRFKKQLSAHSMTAVRTISCDNLELPNDVIEH